MWRLSNQQSGRYVWGSGAAAVMATGGVVMAWMFRNEKVENDDDDAPLWEGQVLKRQVRQPKLPYPLWDYDWDGRMTEQTTLQAQSESIHETVTGTTRHIILIRHGQYEERHHADKKRRLTPLGRKQAELTGKRLAILQKGINQKFGPCSILKIHSSDMQRAKETADIIAKYLASGVERSQPDPYLNEALPAPIIPMRPDIDATMEIDENRERIEEAFQKYIYRDPKTLKEEEEEDGGGGGGGQHEFEIIVGHANIIRYFFCRALQLPPEAWLRLSIFNCSLTYLLIKPNGYVSCRMVGDIGHLGYDHSTFSMHHGFVWS